MKKYLNILLLALSVNAGAQIDRTIPEMTKPSPEVASIGKYGELPINHYTGTANINVPLYVIDFEGLEIPISLSYSTGGIQASQEASWVGLGWSLLVEPVITRRIRGMSDMGGPGYHVRYPNTIALPELVSGFSYSSELWNEIVAHEDNHNGVNTYDTEPDIFTVSLFGETAKFILTQKSLNGGVIGVKMMNADSRIKVVCNESTNSFVVTNDRGFAFHFTKHEYSVTAVEGDLVDSFTVREGFADPLITAWKIEKIVSPKGKILSYNYHDGATIKDQPASTEKKHRVICPDENNAAPWNAYANSFVRPSRSLNCHAALYLSSIVADDQTIEFHGTDRLDIMDGSPGRYPIVTSIFGYTDEKPKKLEHIYIKDFRGNIVKDVQLEYSYFDSNQINNTYFSKEYLRLKLDNISVNGEFFRHFDYLNPNLLPNKLTKSIDYWGFYNGKSNIHIYPSYKATKFCYSGQTVVSVPGADRLPDFSFGKNGLLYKIVYPTRGYSEISYEPHSMALNAQSRNENVPFEDFETFEASSSDEQSPSNSQVFTLNGTAVNSFFTETSNTAISSLFGHVVLEIGCGSGFNSGNTPSSYRKCDVTAADAWKPALQIVNAATGQVAYTQNFSSGPCTAFTCPPISISDGVAVINVPLNTLPAGSYYFRVTALKHISNLYDEEEGIYPGNPDYMKQYYFPVRVKLKLPKSSISEEYSKEIGGARVLGITDFDHDGTEIGRKKYRYILDSSSAQQALSSGILINKLDYGNEYDYGTSDTDCANPNFTGSTRTLTVYSDNRRDQFALSDTHVGYSRVEEIVEAGTGNLTNGKTVYHFSVNPSENDTYSNNASHVIFRPNNPVIDAVNLALVPKRAYEESNGDLLKTETFDASGNLKRKEEITYQYHNYYPPRKIGVGMHIKMLYNYIFNCSNSVPSSIWSSVENMQIYEIKDEVTPLMERKVTEYLTGGEIIRSTVFEYNGQYNVSSISESASEPNTSKTTRNYYPGDAEVAGFPFVSQLATMNIIGAPLRSRQLSGIEPVEQTDREYSIFNGTLLAPYAIKSSKGGNTILPQVEFTLDQYDGKGNLVQYKKANGIPVSIIYGYNKSLSIAKIENIAYDAIPPSVISNLQSKSDTDTETNLISALNALRTDFPNAMITTYTYKPLVGISTITDPKGDKMTYEYDSFGRLKTVRDKDANILSDNEYHYRP